MAATFQLSRDEWIFGLVVSSVHGFQHVFFRLLPPLIPVLVIAFGYPLWQLGLLLSVYMFAGGLFQAPMGVLSDRMDRRYLLVPAFLFMSAGYLIFVGGSIIGDILPAIQVLDHTFVGTYQLMALGMFVAGIGHSVIHPVGYPLISSNVSSENKGKILGMWGSASKVGDAAAPLLAAVFILLLPWEYILVGVSLVGIAYAVGLAILFSGDAYDTTPPVTRATRPGESSTGNELWDDLQTFLLPMAAILLFFFFSLFTVTGVTTYTPVFVTDIYAFTIQFAGVTVGPDSVANLFFSALLISGAASQLVVGGLADVYDHRAVLVALLGIAAFGLFVLSTVTLSPFVLFVVFVCIGGSMFGLYPVRDILISDLTPAAYEGRTFGYIWTAALLVSSVYPFFIGYLGDTIGIQASFGYLALAAVFGMASVAALYSPYVYRNPNG